VRKCKCKRTDPDTASYGMCLACGLDMEKDDPRRQKKEAK
jgi:hypothetical protein